MKLLGEAAFQHHGSKTVCLWLTHYRPEVPGGVWEGSEQAGRQAYSSLWLLACSSLRDARITDQELLWRIDRTLGRHTQGCRWGSCPGSLLAANAPACSHGKVQQGQEG